MTKTLKTTEAQRRAALKWEQENTQKITVKLRRDIEPTKEQIQRAAEVAGLSVNAWIIEAIKEKL